MPIYPAGLPVITGGDEARVTELLRTWNGEGADPLARALVLGDLLGATEAATLIDRAGGPGGPLVESLGGTSTSDTVSAPTGIPTLSSLSATGTFRGVVLDWGSTSIGLYYTEVLRAATDDVGTAQVIGTTRGTTFADTDVDTGDGFYYWVRPVDLDGTPGGTSAVSGVYAEVPKASEVDYADLSIVTAKIADLALGSGKFATGAIAEAKIGDAEISRAKIKDLAVTEAKIKDLAIGSAHIAAAAVETLKLADNAVTIPAVDSGGAMTLNSSWQDVIVKSFTLDRPGKVIVVGTADLGNTSVTREFAAGGASVDRLSGASTYRLQARTVSVGTRVHGQFRIYVDGPGAIWTSGYPGVLLGFSVTGKVYSSTMILLGTKR